MEELRCPNPDCIHNNELVAVVPHGDGYFVGCLSCATHGPTTSTEARAIELWEMMQFAPLTPPSEMSAVERYASIGSTPPVEEPTLHDRFMMAVLPAWIQVTCARHGISPYAAEDAAALAHKTADACMEARQS